jgi:3-hydroxybutyryl-CoA dehydratase
MLKIGDKFEHEYSYTQEQVNLYAEVSGDTNPLHTNEEAGKNSIFGRCIIHGFLGASVFTKIFGALVVCRRSHLYETKYDVDETDVYWIQNTKLIITVKEIFPEKNRVLYDCAVFEARNRRSDNWRRSYA